MIDHWVSEILAIFSSTLDDSLIIDANELPGYDYQ